MEGVERLSLIGVPIDVIKKENMPSVLLRLKDNTKSNQIVFLNLKLLLFARRNTEFMEMLNKAALILPTDKSLVGGLKFLYKITAPRYLSYDFIIATLTLFERSRASVYLLGSSKKVIQTADRNLRTSFPSLLFVGRHTGYFKKTELDLVTDAVRKSSPSLLIVGKGLKGANRWLFRYSNKFQRGITLYNANFFEIIAGKKARPNAEAFEKGTDRWLELLRKPWHIFHIFRYIRYYILLLYYKSKDY